MNSRTLSVFARKEISAILPSRSSIFIGSPIMGLSADLPRHHFLEFRAQPLLLLVRELQCVYLAVPFGERGHDALERLLVVVVFGVVEQRVQRIAGFGFAERLDYRGPEYVVGWILLEAQMREMVREQLGGIVAAAQPPQQPDEFDEAFERSMVVEHRAVDAHPGLGRVLVRGLGLEIIICVHDPELGALGEVLMYHVEQELPHGVAPLIVYILQLLERLVLAVLVHGYWVEFHREE